MQGMRSHGFTDLIKPQWRAVLKQLERSGGLTVTEIAERVGVSYVAVKQHCEELCDLGYLDRTRVPRQKVGRPEISYSFSANACVLFPKAGVDFTLEILANMKGLFGENAPEKLLFQYFQKLELKWHAEIPQAGTISEKVMKLASLREHMGSVVSVSMRPDGGHCMEEFHNPLQKIYERYPRAVSMELRMIEQLLSTRVTRREQVSGRGAQSRVVFEIDAPRA